MSGEELCSLADYVARSGEYQTHIYCMHKIDIERHEVIESLKSQYALEIIFLDDNFDEKVVNSLKEYQNKQFVCITKEFAENRKTQKTEKISTSPVSLALPHSVATQESGCEESDYEDGESEGDESEESDYEDGESEESVYEVGDGVASGSKVPKKNHVKHVCFSCFPLATFDTLNEFRKHKAREHKVSVNLNHSS
jgi:hypothetical protein